MRATKKAEKEIKLGFFLDMDTETIFFSSTFMKGARQMGSGESVLYMMITSEYPTYKRITL